MEIQTEREPERSRPPLLEAGTIGLMLVLATAGLAWWASLPEPPRATASAGSAARPDRFVGSRICGECHPGEYAHYTRSGHARTLRPAAERRLARRLDGAKVEDPEQPGVNWRYSLRDGTLNVERAASDSLGAFVLEYAFGSGRHATTFVSLRGSDPRHPRGFEHRLSVFAHAGGAGLGLTPGQSLRGHAAGNTPEGRLHTTDDTRRCFQCHTTLTSDRGLDVLDTATMIPNVSCERCHGPGREHVAAARSNAESETLAMPLGPGRESPAEQVRRCGACHRLPEMVRPGSIRTDNPVLVRHQSVGLLQSACSTASQGALSCVTCHDPHARVETNRGHYEAACLSCHRSSSRSSRNCPVSPRSGCVECHMPRRDVARGMMMTDHWIRILPELDPRHARKPSGQPTATGATGQGAGRSL